MTPQIYYALPFVDYCALYAVNNSLLKVLDVSPAALVAHLRTGVEDRDTLRYGRLFHTLVLEPERFEADYALYHGSRRAGKEWLEFEAVHAARTIIPVGTDASAATMASMMSMADAVRAYAPAAEVLDGADTEVTIIWTDPETGIVCKARPDIIGNGTLADLKKTRSTVERRFSAQAADLGYFEQLAFYRRSIVHGLGWTPKRVCFIAAEDAAPHEPAVFDVDADTLDAADKRVSARLRRLAECRDSGAWPGRHASPVALTAPRWWLGTPETDPTRDEAARLAAQYASGDYDV